MEGGDMGMIKMLWGASIIADIATFWVNDDKWGTTNNPDWDNAMVSAGTTGAFRFITFAGHMIMPDLFEGLMMPIAGLTAVWEIANLYLINKAEGALANTTSNATTIGYACSAFGLAVSVMAAMEPADGDDMEEDDEEGDYDLYYDDYYEEEPEDEEPAEEEGGDEDGGYDYYGYYY